MALVPRYARNWWDDIDRHHRDIEEHLRQLSLRDDDLWRTPLFPSFFDGVYWSRWDSFSEKVDRHVGGSATVKQDADKYHIIVNVQQFAPEDITVRTDDRYITIEAQQERRKGWRGYESREFKRRYLLPKGYDINQVKPSLSSDGILTITAPRFTYYALPALGQRVVPIRRTYLPAIKAI